MIRFGVRESYVLMRRGWLSARWLSAFESCFIYSLTSNIQIQIADHRELNEQLCKIHSTDELFACCRVPRANASYFMSFFSSQYWFVVCFMQFLFLNHNEYLHRNNTLKENNLTSLFIYNFFFLSFESVSMCKHTVCTNTGVFRLCTLWYDQCRTYDYISRELVPKEKLIHIKPTDYTRLKTVFVVCLFHTCTYFMSALQCYRLLFRFSIVSPAHTYCFGLLSIWYVTVVTARSRKHTHDIRFANTLSLSRSLLWTNCIYERVSPKSTS